MADRQVAGIAGDESAGRDYVSQPIARSSKSDNPGRYVYARRYSIAKEVSVNARSPARSLDSS